VHQQLQYDDQQVSILARARSTFHLSALEANYIKTFKAIQIKEINPIFKALLCNRHFFREMILRLKLISSDECLQP